MRTNTGAHIRSFRILLFSLIGCLPAVIETTLNVIAK